MNDNQIETLLRQAPRPPAPAGLKKRLLRDIPNTQTSRQTRPSTSSPSWLRRWFPALSFGCLILSCLTVLGVQTAQLFELRAERDRLRLQMSELARLRGENQELRLLQKKSDQAKLAARDYAELLALRDEAAQWREQNQIAVNLRAEIDQLKTAHNEAIAAARNPDQPDPFSDMLAKAQSIECVNNLKRICLAARIWGNQAANNPEDYLPRDFATMTKELRHPRTIICPASSTVIPDQGWDQFNFANATYEILSPGASSRFHPDAVFTRCPIHGHIGRADGSVFQIGLDAEFITKDGITRVAPKPAVTP